MLVFIDWQEYSAFRMWETDMIHRLVDGWMHVFLLLYLICFFFSHGIPLAVGTNTEREVNMAGSLEFPFDCCWQVHAPDGGNEYDWHAFLFSMMI